VLQKLSSVWALRLVFLQTTLDEILHAFVEVVEVVANVFATESAAA
jgi:hypothetical protein